MLGRITTEEHCISAERLACIAEQGLAAEGLTKNELLSFAEHGLEEVYDLWHFSQLSIPALDPYTLDAVMKRFYPETVLQTADIWVRVKDTLIEILGCADSWIQGSPAFATRANEDNQISFHKKFGKLTVHLEIVRRDSCLADIHVKLSDNTIKAPYFFEVELMKGQRSLETIDAAKDSMISFYSVEIDDYLLRVSDMNKEIASLSLRMEK